MDPLFSGSVARQRHINLGGTAGGPSSSAQLAAEARSSRHARNNLRRQELSAITLQSAWRGSQVRAAVREIRRQSFRAAVNAGAFSSLCDLQNRQLSLHATRSLRSALGPDFAGRTAAAGTVMAEEDLLTAWSQAMVASTSTASTPAMPALVLLLQAVSEEFNPLAASIIQKIGLHLAQHAQHIPLASQTAYLHLYRIVLDPFYIDAVPEHCVLARGVLREDFIIILKAVILTFVSTAEKFTQIRVKYSHRCDKCSQPTNRKADSVRAELVSSLLLVPFAILSGSSGNKLIPNGEAEQVARTVASFAENILSISSLPSRFPVLLLAKLAAQFPLTETIRYMAARLPISGNKGQRLAALHTLANILALSNQRVPLLDNGEDLVSYLEALTRLQQSFPGGLLTANDTLIDSDTLKRLSILPSPKHITAILSASSKSPSVTRPALYDFLCATLTCWDAETKAQVINTVLYGTGETPGGGSYGFVRELWRRYVRSSPVARSLSSISANQFDASLLAEQQQGWAPIVVLCELYSRLLLTLGDDEFFPPRGNLTCSSSDVTMGLPKLGETNRSLAGYSVAARNPLMIEEVMGLAALVRNLAFALFWYLDVSPIAPSLRSLDDTRLVPGLSMSFITLRDLSTRLLQQIHARDARTRFTNEDFWLMTDEMDIDSFVQSVMLEENKLAEEEADAHMHTGAISRLEDDEDENDGHNFAPVVPRIARPFKRHVSARKLAFISPRLGTLNNLPFVIPFTTRIQIFRAFIYKDAARLQLDRTAFTRRRTATVRRNHVAEDGMAQLNGLGSALKQRIEIIFMDQWGMQEAGIDGGGVFKEFLTSLIRESFDTDRGLWKATDQQELYPNPSSYARQSEQLQWYSFLGRVLGKALYEGILVDVRFASFFLSKWLGRRQGMGHLDDLASLKSLDPELYRGLIYLKNYAGDVETDLSLNFTVTDEEFGERKVTELIPNGVNVSVTNKNRLSYIYMVARYRLDAQIRAQSTAFFVGLSELIDPRWLRIFDQAELQRLIKGSEEPIDINDLRSNTVYSDYHEKDLAVQYFWQALESFDQPTRAALLKFVTSCPSPPLLGFSQLNPKFCIRLSSEDARRLPTSSTCVNLLKLPRYGSLEQCRDKLLTAIRSSAGFDLS